MGAWGQSLELVEELGRVHLLRLLPLAAICRSTESVLLSWRKITITGLTKFTFVYRFCSGSGSGSQYSCVSFWLPS